jgi:hypothetical protein
VPLARVVVEWADRSLGAALGLWSSAIPSQCRMKLVDADTDPVRCECVWLSGRILKSLEVVH